MPVCPGCHGKKQLMAFGIVYAPGHSGPSSNLVDCPDCDGTGEISEQQVDWRRRGEIHRRSRIEAGIGLREYSERHGISPAELCRMESGKADPTPLGV